DAAPGQRRRSCTPEREVPEFEVHEVGPQLVDERGEVLSEVDPRREMLARQQSREVLPLLVVTAVARHVDVPARAEQAEELADDEALGELGELVADEQDTAHRAPTSSSSRRSTRSESRCSSASARAAARCSSYRAHTSSTAATASSSSTNASNPSPVGNAA